MIKKILFKENKRFVYKKSDGGHAVASASVETASDEELPEGLTVEKLLELRSNKEGLEAFLNDFAEIEEQKNKRNKAELEKSATARLMLAQQLDEKTDEETAEIREKVTEDGKTFSDSLFELIHDVDMDMEDKVERVDELLAEFEERILVKEKKESQHREIVQSLNAGKAIFLSSIIALPIFGSLPLLWRKKVEAMAESPDFTTEDLAEEASKLIKENTGEDVDMIDLIIAKQFSDDGKAALEVARTSAEEGDDMVHKGVRGAIVEGTTSLVDWVQGAMGLIKGSPYSQAFGGMAKAIGISKNAMFACANQGPELQTVAQLREGVADVTYASLLLSCDGNEKRAKKAWEAVKQSQKVVAWLDAHESEIKDLLDEAIDRLPNLSDEDREALKLQFELENMRVAQVAFAMFGDKDLERDWFIKAPTYVAKVKKTYDVFKHGLGGVVLDYLNPSSGHRASVATEARKYSDRVAKIEFDLHKKLGTKMPGENIFDVISDLDKSVEGLELQSDKITATHIAERNKRVEAYQETVHAVEKRFEGMAQELSKQGEMFHQIEKSAGNVKGKTLGSLSLGTEAKELMTRLLGGKLDLHMPLEEALGKAKLRSAENIAGIAQFQSKLNHEILSVRDKLFVRIEKMQHVAKMQHRGQNIAEAVKHPKTALAMHYGPKAILPTFGVGMAAWRGFQQKQGLAKTSLMVAEAGVSFIPYVGGLVDFGLGLNGYDLAGNKLSTMERASYMGFGVVGFAADVFGGYAVRAGLTALIRGRKSVKALTAVGKERSVLMGFGKSVSKVGGLFSKPKQLEHAKIALKTATESADILRSKAANGALSFFEKRKLAKLDSKIASLEAKQARLTSQLPMSDILKSGSKAVKGGAIKGYSSTAKITSRVMSLMEKASLPMILATIISEGNVTPVDLGEYAVKGVKVAGQGVSMATKRVFQDGGMQPRAVDEMLGIYLQEKQAREAVEARIDETGEDTVTFMQENMHLPQVATVAARSGLSGSELLRSDSGRRLAESLLG